MRTEIAALLDAVSVDRIRRHIEALEGVRHPVVAPDALEEAACYIERTLRSLGYDVQSHFFQHEGQEMRNIVATQPGARHPEEAVLVMAHYDTVANSPGADDNASGVAVLLELATILKTARFERTVQFVAVNLEERQYEEGPLKVAGLFGSRAMATESREGHRSIAGVIVLESVAFAGEEIEQRTPEGMPIEMPNKADFIAVVGNEDSAEIVRAFVQTGEQYQIPLPILPLVAPGRGETMSDVRRSDHASFWDQDYPAVMVTDTANFRNPHYHQPSDTLETLNLPFAARVCQVTGGAVAEMAGVHVKQDLLPQPGTALETVIIFTSRMEELAAFYQETLQLGPFERSPGHLGCQVGPVYLGFDQMEEAQEKKAPQVTLWFTVDDIDAAFRRLVAAGAEVRYGPTRKPWGALLAAVYDPDGNLIGLAQREA